MYALETPRLGLRPFEQDDFEFLVALNADPDVARFIGYGVPRTREETREFLEHVLTAYEEDSLGHLAVYLKGSGALVGRCGLTLLEVEAEPAGGKPPQWYWFRGGAPKGMLVVNEIELGYTFSKEHWGCGYATECAKAMRDFGFRELGLSRLASAIAPENLASKNVARKVGLAYSGIVTAFSATFERHELSSNEWIGLINAA